MRNIDNRSLRNQSIDLIKGLCIIFMVFGHTAVKGTVLGFVYLFHMSVFLLLVVIYLMKNT